MSRICRLACGATTVPAEGCTADGFWHCVSCHISFTNNSTATMHETTHSRHQLAWWCFAHDRLELITVSTSSQGVGA
jgi:hypothetical protein